MAEDGDHAVGNLLVYYHLAYVHLVVVVPVQGTDVAQVVASDVGILLIGLTLHLCPHAIGDRLGGEAFVNSAKGFDGLLTNGAPCLPLGERLRIDGKRKVGLRDALAVDGLEVIAHGDDVVAGLTPLLAQLESLLAVGMVAHVVVGNEHKRRRLILRVTERIVVHGCVAAAVAEGEHRHLANLLGYLLHLVRLQVLDDEFVGAQDALLTAHRVVDALCRTLGGGHEPDVHTDDTVGGDADAFRQRAADETVAARHHIAGEAVAFQIVEHLQHRLVETLAVGHARKTVGGLGSVCLHVGIKLGQCHAGVGLGSGVGMLHVEVVGQRLAVAHEVAYLLCRLHHVLRSLVVGVVQRAVFQQVVLEVRGIEFAHKRTVHVERGDAVFLLDIIG